MRRVDSHWVEVSLGERRGLVPVSYLEEEEVEGSRQSSLSSSPCTPPSPNPGVMVERLTRPTDIIKSRLRGQFCRRERSMVTVERFLQVRGGACSGDPCVCRRSCVGRGRPAVAPAPPSLPWLDNTALSQALTSSPYCLLLLVPPISDSSWPG